MLGEGWFSSQILKKHQRLGPLLLGACKALVNPSSIASPSSLQVDAEF